MQGFSNERCLSSSGKIVIDNSTEDSSHFVTNFVASDCIMYGKLNRNYQSAGTPVGWY